MRSKHLHAYPGDPDPGRRDPDLFGRRVALAVDVATAACGIIALETAAPQGPR